MNRRTPQLPPRIACLVVAVCLAPLGCGGSPTGDLAGWNLLLVTLDTTRADRLGCYGHESALTPRLDALAADGIRFDAAAAHTPLTLPSHASILTGLNPPSHGARTNGFYVLDERHRTLAEILSAAGYQTAAVIAAVVLDRRFGLEQGFDRFDDSPVAMTAEARFSDASRRAPDVTRAALEAADAFAPDSPFFLWAHYFDPHAPYDPPADLASRFPADRSGRYDAEIAAMDHAIGDLLDGLAARAHLERTLVVVIGDHGEGFPGPHEERTHGLLVFEDTMRIPFLVSAPGGLPEGRVDRRVARQVDVLPTVLELLGVDAGPELASILEGRSLVPRLLGRPPDDEPLAAYGETLAPWASYGWSPLFALRTPRWKYIEGPQPELYDLEADPGESTDVSGENPEVATELALRLRAILEDAGETDGLRPGLADPETAKRLGALGYGVGAQAAPALSDLAELPHPRARLDTVARLNEIGDLHAAGRSQEALRELRDVLLEEPRNYDAAYRLTQILFDTGDFDGAARAARTLTELRPGLPHGTFLRGTALARRAEALARTGRRTEAGPLREEAIAVLREATRGGQIGAPAHVDLARVLLAVGQRIDAAAELHRALELDPRSYHAHLTLGLVRQETGDLEGARRHLEQAIEAAGGDPARERAPRTNLIDVYRGLGERDAAAAQLEWFLARFPDDPKAAAGRKLLESIRTGH